MNKGASAAECEWSWWAARAAFGERRQHLGDEMRRYLLSDVQPMIYRPGSRDSDSSDEHTWWVRYGARAEAAATLGCTTAIKGLGSAAWAEESQAADILIGLAREATGPLRHAALEGLEGAAFHEHTGTLTLLVEVALRRGDPCRFVALNSLAPVAALGHVAARAAFDRAITDASDDDCDETGLSIQLAALLILEGAESTLAGATLS